MTIYMQAKPKHPIAGHTKGRISDIAVKQNMFGSGIQIWKLRGRDNEVAGSRIKYANMAEFLLSWESFDRMHS